MLLVETAGLCLRCSPYVEGLLGIVVLEATSGMNLPRKIGPDAVAGGHGRRDEDRPDIPGRAEVFRARINGGREGFAIVETNALYGIGIEP